MRFLRVLLGLGQETVAERSGLNISTVRLIERGRVSRRWSLGKAGSTARPRPPGSTGEIHLPAGGVLVLDGLHTSDLGRVLVGRSTWTARRSRGRSLPDALRNRHTPRAWQARDKYANRVADLVVMRFPDHLGTDSGPLGQADRVTRSA